MLLNYRDVLHGEGVEDAELIVFERDELGVGYLGLEVGGER